MKTVLVAILGIVLLAGVGVGGYQLGQSNGLTEAQNIRTEFFQSRSGTPSAQSNSGQPGTNVRSQTGRPMTSGTIKSIQDQVIEVNLQDGSTILVALSTQTVLEKLVTATSSDLQVGQHISVQGVQATGQINAQLIQISQSGQ